MKSARRIMSFAIAAAVALFACAQAVGETAILATKHAITQSWGACARLMVRVVSGPVPLTEHTTLRPKVERVKAVAFVQRVAQRRAPTVRDQWRMCPSI